MFIYECSNIFELKVYGEYAPAIIKYVQKLTTYLHNKKVDEFN